MFYLIIAILVVLYYFFMAPKTIRNTLNMIGLAASVVLLLTLAVMSFIKIIQFPPEIFVTIGMVLLAYFAFKDIWNLAPKKPKK
ncbi:DUF3165 family protein [Streptococcus chenjunshii]|uniref:DUF3165 family protein n=1 Tax=Streptococcus chenjunshii TaxID=2173853 RepID=A0A372KM91_9STRE|nr:DUF3165 family protein [Streptococcus chenjunshii]AXQ78206.1 DUF3165 family protein [Streptococcus chenjunshii]RFU50923.1 DUF3165 family protein [Streptococcus chenjunshii]RFU53420.1 DUF3165 family protein [Streptococcus chenjunshii]